ncbi:maleylacetoacetate isomerase [Photobacterium ganghwense]|uniref:Maleylacetoacetate isomerase n=1 Tax=Photobacterium ganghwense TaxID=320778 RepID=A0A0J1K0G0_9GAMM|nr:maleylacetoacetate isomerase [Photobacterium ganghwense]KLV07952.1 maleylacetoacetate isomerase [Photobacterium ganghwense]PSU07055.1 maleylacetoacetate isomerase [Photobacterium ganghwense]QSV15809.1 maleylacetoacetate isomerase [Photobacterium ganghwense]
MKLYDYYRSSASYRVRIALNLKGLEYAQQPVSLLDNEQNSTTYTALNPSGLVPGFIPDPAAGSENDGELLSQSLAIIEYLDERYPEPPLLPSEPWQKAKCREIAFAIACDIHPLNNLRVLKYLTGPLAIDESEKMAWYHHWLKQGLQSLEVMVSRHSHPFCCGDEPSLADICLIPQLYNAKRFGFDLSHYPRLLDIEARCQALPAFIAAHPDNQQP